MGPSRVGRAVAAAGLVTLFTGTLALGTAAATPPNHEPKHLDRALHGEDAIVALGDSLPDAAAKNRQSPDQFKHLLRTDHSVWVDRDDRMFVIESPAPAASPTADDQLTSQPSAIPDDQAFLLHSNPGSQRTIFLDFNGQLTQNTAWNASYTSNQAFTAAPYDTDGHPDTFSSTELGVVKSVWERVSEDYGSLDVDVTTQEPDPSVVTRSSSSDLQYGTRAQITSGNTIYSSCGCGGIAYVGTFDYVGSSYYQPAWIFANGVPGAKNIAEAVAHEVGHNLGLSHDGTASVGYYSGQGNWAPIMGVGYYMPVSQWSKGEYTGANNKEDDFAVMASHGAPARPDDNGDTPATATVVTGPSFSRTGRITTRADVDAFRIDAVGGPASFAVTPEPTSPDLDASLTLLDGTGAIVATNDPASFAVNGDEAGGMGASLSVTLAAGTYTLLVDGVGKGSPLADGYSDYASVGLYRITGTVTSGPPAPDFSIAASPAGGRTIPSGVGTTFAVDLVSVGGFADPVTLSVTGAPAGSSFTDNPPVWNGTAANSTLTIPADAAVGTYDMTVTGDDGNGHTHTSTTKLNVGSDFAVSVTPNSAQVLPGKTTTYTAKVTRAGSYPSTVALSATGLPAGATVAFTPTSVSPTLTGATSTMKVTTTTSAKPGNYTVTVTATGADPNHTVHTVDVGLVIAGFAVTVSQPTVSLAHGTSKNVTVTVTAFGSFAGTVSLAISNLPSNTTAVLSPKSFVPSTGGTTSTLTITAKSTATPATKTATLKGQASGVSAQVVNLPVTIT